MHGQDLTFVESLINFKKDPITVSSTESLVNMKLSETLLNVPRQHDKIPSTESNDSTDSTEYLFKSEKVGKKFCNGFDNKKVSSDFEEAEEEEAECGWMTYYFSEAKAKCYMSGAAAPASYRR